jgi:predicted transcriptional regulator
MSPSPSVVLLSVRPPHVDRLLEGSKTVELRRRRWRVPPGSVVLLYASGQRQALVGSIVVCDTVSGTPDEIWASHGDASALTRQEFDEYFAGCSEAVAITVHSARPLFNPVSLGELRRRSASFIPPQSYRYVDPKELSRLLNGEYGALVAR